MRIYIASSWKNQHAVEMLTAILRGKGYEIVSFVENNYGEFPLKVSFDEWVLTNAGEKAFIFDTYGATSSDLVIYIGPSGTDAWAEVGAAWGAGVPILGLWAKSEPAGLMRKMVKEWFTDHAQLLGAVVEGFPL